MPNDTPFFLAGLVLRYCGWMLVGLVVLSVCLSGCGGGGARLEAHQSTTTLGQELKDLEDAYQKGMISKEEYEKSKKRFIKRTK